MAACTVRCTVACTTRGRAPPPAAATAASRPRQSCCVQPPAARHWQPQQRRRAAAAAAGGSGGKKEKPQWVRDLEETADFDKEAARLLAGTNSDPELIRQRMRQEEDALYSRIMDTKYGGEDAPVSVVFRSPLDRFGLWVWLELYGPPTGADVELLQSVVNAWFVVGRMGGYNSSNLQVLYGAGADLADLEYDAQEEGAQMPSTFHDIGDLETQGSWARFWLDMGTADELALDVLINALCTLSREQLGIRQLLFGGQNDDWPTPQREEFIPQVTMDPMRVGFGPGFAQAGEEGEEEDEDEEDDDAEFEGLGDFLP